MEKPFRWGLFVGTVLTVIVWCFLFWYFQEYLRNVIFLKWMNPLTSFVIPGMFLLVLFGLFKKNDYMWIIVAGFVGVWIYNFNQSQSLFFGVLMAASILFWNKLYESVVAGVWMGSMVLIFLLTIIIEIVSHPPSEE